MAPPDKCQNCKRPRADHVTIYGQSMALVICPTALWDPTGAGGLAAAPADSSSSSSSSPAPAFDPLEDP